MVIHELKLGLDNDNGDKGSYNFEDFEIYKMVFDSTLLITASNEHDEQVNGLENSYIDKFIVEQVLEAVAETELTSSGLKNEFSNVCIHNQLVQKKISDTDIDDLGVEKILEGSIHAESRNDVKISDTKNMEELYEELDRFEDCVQEIEMNSDSDKGSEELSKVKQMILLEKVGKGSKEEKVGVNLSDHGKVSGILGRSRSWRSNSSSILSSHGSMKEEKEWRRTLACKLFEERHNSRGGEEGMDSLWEDHENSNSKKYDSGIKRYSDDEDDEDVEMSNGHLCCLQALRFSSGKMNLGMRKPNLVKISKALKGFGWLHHVKNKNGKKS
ncbi:hypothetical protein Tco_1078586 [Tanacetum coccineum]|uniref:Uncharacterized protein n=1 Tax=Tanacetum coccineum TaxID=301880 RepID=A0ABQ5HQL2_9ASTR